MAGASTVGRLIIDIAADVAQLRSDMSTATGIVEQSGATITSVANMARAALSALGIAFSVGEVKAWADGVISSTAALNDFAQRTGSSVESLSRLTNQAVVSGVEIGTLQQLTMKLAVNMRDMGDESKAAGAAMAFLGVTSKDPAEALTQIAVALDQYADGIGKAALAKDIFGRNGPQFLDFLHDLAQAHGVAATRTTEQAKAADELEESWRRLKVGSTTFSDALLNWVVPALERTITYAVKARDAGLGLLEMFPPQGDRTIQGATDRLVAAQEKLIDIQRRLSEAQTQGGIIGAGWVTHLEKQAAAAQDNVNKYSALVNSYYNTSAAADTAFPKIAANYKSASDAAKVAKDATEDFLGEINRLATELDKLTSPSGAASEYGKALRTIETALQEGKIVTNEAIDTLLTWAETVDYARQKAEAYKAALAEWQAQEKAFNDARMNYQKALDAAATSAERYLRSLQDIIQASEDEVATLGMSAEQIRVVNAAREIDRRTREKILELGSKITDATRDQILLDAEEAKASVAASTAKVAAYRDWLDLMQTAAVGVKDFLLDFVENGSSAFKRLWQNFKNWALEALAEIAAKQIVVSIVGALGIGGATGAQAAGGISLGQGANLLSSLFGGGGTSGGNILGNLFGSGNAGSILGNAGELLGITGGASSFVAAGGAFDAVAAGGLSIGLEAGAGSAAAAGGVGALGAIGAAMPYVGAALAIYMLGKKMGWWDKSGGPMTREFGLAGGDLASFGNLSELHKLVGTDAKQTSGYDSAAGGLLSSYQALAKLLGVDPGSASFAVYSSTDPQGDAPSNVDVRANVGGAQVYAGDNFNVGRSAEDLEAEIKRQGQLAILNALRATDLPAIVGEFLGLVNVGTQTFDAIMAAAVVMTKLPEQMQRAWVDLFKLDPAAFEQLSAFNKAFVDLSAALDAGDAAVQSFKDGVVETTESVYEKATRLNTGLVELANSYDGSTEQTAALASATGQYIGAMTAALQQIAQVREGLSTMFGNSIRDINMAIMTTVERSAFLKNEALQNIDLLKKTTDPAQIDKLSKIINTDLMAVFNMLSPEEQKRQSAWFIQQLELTGNTADAQLIKSGNNLSNVLDVIRTKLSDAATMQYNAAVAFGIAAGTISESAGQMLIAANTPVVVKTDVTVDVKKDQPEDNVTVTTTNPMPDLVADGGWGWLANPDPNVIYATPGP